MKLSLEQIKAVTVGAVNIYQDEVGFHFKRFTDSQLEIFGAKREQFRIRTNSTAGCQLSFYTDSGMIIIEVVSGVKFEVLVDGLPYHFSLLDGPKKLPISLPCGRKHIVLSLPNYSEGILAGICLDEGSYVEPYTYQKKFLFLGDSITQGSQSTRDSFCYAYRVSRFFDAEILNLGVGGSYMSADTLEDVGFDPDAVFIAYGTNDYTHFDSIVSAETACREYFDKVTVCDKAVVTSGPYERYFEKDGKIYHHIIDPFTGYPAKDGRGSATVVSKDSALADALSTAVFISGKGVLKEFKDRSEEHS